MATEEEQLTVVMERLERAEDNFLNLIERYPHLLKEPHAVEIMREMRVAISDLRMVVSPF